MGEGVFCPRDGEVEYFDPSSWILGRMEGFPFDGIREGLAGEASDCGEFAVPIPVPETEIPFVQGALEFVCASGLTQKDGVDLAGAAERAGHALNARSHPVAEDVFRAGVASGTIAFFKTLLGLRDGYGGLVLRSGYAGAGNALAAASIVSALQARYKLAEMGFGWASSRDKSDPVSPDNRFGAGAAFCEPGCEPRFCHTAVWGADKLAGGSRG